MNVFVHWLVLVIQYMYCNMFPGEGEGNVVTYSLKVGNILLREKKYYAHPSAQKILKLP